MATFTEGVSRGSNGSLSYTNSGNTYTHTLWVNVASQTFGVSGESHQSRVRKVFYPRANQVGNIKIDGVCQSQTDYHELALFIRKHQRAMIHAPHTDLYTRQSTGNDGPNRLLRLSVPSEGISVRGFIEKFQVSKKGLFDPAPQYTFELLPVFDRSHTNYAISHDIQKYFKGSKAKTSILPNTAAQDNLTDEERQDAIDRGRRWRLPEN